MSSMFRLSLLAGSILLAHSAYAVTESVDSDSSGLKETMTVVGNWLDAQDNSSILLNHPGARTIVTEEKMKEKGSETIADVLRGIPGVQVRDNNGTGGSDISLNVGVRGLTARLSPRSTILMDGVPLAVAPYGQPQLSMAPLSIGNLQSVDVVRGGGSVRYGPQNVGGVINFVTKSIPKEFGGDASVQTQGAGKGGLKTLTSTSVGGTADNGFGAVLLYSGLHGQGYRASNDNTDIDDVMLKTSYALTEKDQLAANFHYYDAQSGMPGGLTSAQYADDPFQVTRPYDEFSGRRKDVSLKYKHQEDDRQFELLSYYTDSYRGSGIESEGSGANAGKKRMVTYPRNYTTYGIEPSYSQVFHHQYATQEITVGYRYLKETMDEKAYRSGWYNPATITSAPDATDYYQHTSGGTEAHAVYLDDTINVGNWTLIPGIRYENIRTHVDDSFADTHRKEHYSEPLPSMNAMYHLTDEWKLFANASTSFGSMQYFQLSKGGNGNDPAPGLSAEKAHTYEVGTRFDDTVWTGEFTLFYIDFDNQLQYISNTVGWTSLGATKHKGLELALTYDLSDLSRALDGASIYSSYSYTKATSDNGDFAGKDLPFYSRSVVTVGSRYQTGNWVWNVDSYAQSKQRSPGTGPDYITQESADGQFGDIPGYMVWNFRGEYDFGPQVSNLKVGAGVKNLFDQRYYTRSNDNNFGKYVGDPRIYFVQASLAF
ncbi:TonB-dependent siderophore receptor [Budviciaceae bacterium BWR-B9]|uniref:TonB-dependent siderophore receptor n=2 Tax=Budviciaceae TaxID=1903416 RepID=A0ABS1IRH6_9GAMM|nr:MULTISPECIES: TonB-dependent siderophore receptor [Limnobaculum]MBK5144356.1 TonB-dependent siderophore receptor [Limnobaculum allomyrinae]MBV7691899.1 TonB-dependent siderophore receptor [Limnobaculum sp. M2-1]